MWALLAGAEDTDKALEHWSPVYPENNRQFQKRLREIIPPQARQSDQSSKVEETTEQKNNEENKSEEEDAEVASHASTEETNKQENEDSVVVDPAQAILERARLVVMQMEACTPDEMFADYTVSRLECFCALAC
jgi:hypothetical protein